MRVKYMLDGTTDLVIDDYTNATLHKFNTEDGAEYNGWGVVFMTEIPGIILRVKVTSFEVGAEILNTVFEEGKVDISANANVICDKCTIGICESELNEIFGALYDEDEDDECE